jgi:hypothetical protein
MAVYKLCSCRHRTQPRCFPPDPLSFARARPYPLPTLFEPAQIAELLRMASALPPHSHSPLRPHVVRLAIVLLYTAGLRRGSSFDCGWTMSTCAWGFCGSESRSSTGAVGSPCRTAPRRSCVGTCRFGAKRITERARRRRCSLTAGAAPAAIPEGDWGRASVV